MALPLDESQEKIRLPGRRTPPGGGAPCLSAAVLAPFAGPLLSSLAGLCRRRRQELYFSGGVVRDWLLGLVPVDVDLTVPDGALPFARQLAAALGAAFVPLSPAEGVARVVWGDLCLDISQFREGTTSIDADLGRRDFTINAMAVAFDPVGQGLADGGRIIDPLDGCLDLAQGIIRLAHPLALANDPLRLLRAYRFRAVLGLGIDGDTAAAIAAQAPAIRQVSGERLACELDKILASCQAHSAMQEMAEAGLLFQLFPELGLGVGLLQPASHHLDVFSHSLETLRQMELIIAAPAALFFRQAGAETPCFGHDLAAYLHAPRQIIRLKYAALLHDLGKTVTWAEKEGRMTFYNHDEAGVAIIFAIADRLRWSNEDARRISQLVKQHMWPFHLHNAKQKTGISPRAILKLVKAAGDDLIGLFLLVMADSLAGQGPGKPPGMEEGVAALFAEVYHTYLGRLKPIMASPLLTGDDLINTLGLTPGPLFRQILDALLEARAAEPEMSKACALAWARDYVDRLAAGDVEAVLSG